MSATDLRFKINRRSPMPTFIGGGIGYEWNNWLRFEGTAEYRIKARVYAFGNYPPRRPRYLRRLPEILGISGQCLCRPRHVGLLDAVRRRRCRRRLLQLPEFLRRQPERRLRLRPQSDEWHLAWALYAGVAYNVSKNLKIDLTYRYLNYGSITDTVDCNGGCYPDRSSSTISTQTTSCSACAGPAAMSRRRRRVTRRRRRRCRAGASG